VSAKKTSLRHALTPQVLGVGKEHSREREGAASTRGVVSRTDALDEAQALFAKENGRVNVASLQRRLAVPQRKQRTGHSLTFKIFLLRQSLTNLRVGKGSAEAVSVAAANLQHWATK
jgi:hypothetical protein